MTVASGRLALPSGTLVAIMCAAVLLLFAAGSALPQSAPPPQPAPGLKEQPAEQGQPSPAQVAPQPTPQPSESPGLIDQMGKLLEKSLSVLPPLKSPTDTIGDLGTRAKDAAKDAGDALSRLAPGSMVSGHAMCPPAVNGTPDCKLGADKLCQGKGYKEGKSLNTDSTQTCSAKVLIPGRQRKPEDCRTDTFVTAALCQ